MSGIILGKNQYGKAEVRMVYVDRSTPVHEITDVNVTSQLIGDFADTHLTGANDAVIATDTQKNTVYAMARTGGFGSPEEFALRLARNYVSKYEQVTGARMAVEQYSWDRITTTGGPHDHAFSKGTAEARKNFEKTRPKLIAGFGGYPSYPSLSAARALGLPIMIHTPLSRISFSTRVVEHAFIA